MRQKIQMAYKHVRRGAFSPETVKMHNNNGMVSLFLDKYMVLGSNGTNHVAGGNFPTMPGK